MIETTQKPKWTIAKTAVVTVLVIAAFLGTMIIRIPIPATTGYFNIGDVFVMLAGLWLGPTAGLIVGVFGPGAADAVGYPQFILATAVTKGIEGWLVGFIGHNAKSDIKRIVAVIVGATTIVVGYFVFEAYIYPAIGKQVPFFDVTTYQAALIEAGPNAVQGIVGGILALGLFRAINAVNLSEENPMASEDVVNEKDEET